MKRSHSDVFQPSRIAATAWAAAALFTAATLPLCFAAFAPHAHAAATPADSRTAASSTTNLEGEMLLVLSRINDFSFPALVWELTIDVYIPAEIDGITISAPDGTLIHMQGFEDDDLWDAYLHFSTLNQAKQFCHGQWTITVFADSTVASVSNFSWATSGIAESDFYSSPVITFPSHNQFGVPQCPVFQWLDPTGELEAEVLHVGVSDEWHTDEQFAVNVFGDFDISATSYQFPSPLIPGFNEFEVFYGNFSDGSELTDIIVTFGNMEWNRLDFAPDDYPEAAPLLLAGSLTIIAFDVDDAGTAECPPWPANPADLNNDGVVDGADLLILLSNWGTCDDCNNCLGNLNDDCAVDGADLLILLSNWG